MAQNLKNYLLPLALFTISLAACGGGDDGETNQQPLSGAELYMEPHPDGNTFACLSCHALEEPTADGFIRPGHPIGDAFARPDYKNGQLGTLREAVNVCRTEWMVADAWEADDPDWLALEGFLREESEQSAPTGTAPALTTAIVIPPPADLSVGGDPVAGQEIFNGRCIVCHGMDGGGTERAPEVTGLALDFELIGRRVRTSGEENSAVYEGLTGGRMPYWSEDRLSDQQLFDVAAYVNTSESAAPGVGEPPPGNGGGATGRECGSTHSKIGQTAVLNGRSHSVAGTATIIDDCTIEITNFSFDGGGINIQMYGGLGGNYDDGFSFSRNLKNEVFDGETVSFQLSEENTLDDLDGLSVWCVPVGADFGSGSFN